MHDNILIIITAPFWFVGCSVDTIPTELERLLKLSCYRYCPWCEQVLKHWYIHTIICCNTCSDGVCILGTLHLHVCSFLDLETPGESLLGFPERLQHEGLLVVTDNPTALRLPFMVQSSSANHITEHISTGVLLFQAVPVSQENSSVSLTCWTNNKSTVEETN